MNLATVRRAAVGIAIALVTASCGDSSTDDGSSDDARTVPPEVATARDQVAGTDLTGAVVDLDDIIFDTFDGGSIPLTEASEAEVAALRDAIAPIDDPTYETNPDWLTPDDLVLGFIDSTGQAWAWPHRILNFHEIVNDTIDGVPLLVSYCPLCRSGVVYDRRVPVGDTTRTLSFGNTSALYENDLVMVDRETNTFWWQVRGLGLVGELAGVELPPLPSRTTTWRQWSGDHPETMMLTRESGGRLYDQDPFATYVEFIDTGRFPFPVSDASANDDRLPSSTLVVVITVNGATYAVSTVGEPREVNVEGVTVRLDGAGGGDAVIGDDPYASRSTFWFAAVGAFPDIEIVE